MMTGPKHSPTNTAQCQWLSRLGKRGTYGLRRHSSESSTQRTIKPEPGSSVLIRNNSTKNLKVVEQNSLEIQNSNEKGRGLYSNVEIKKGEIIGVYGGTLLTKEEAIALESTYNCDTQINARIQYLFDLETVVQDGYSPLINEVIIKLNENERFNRAGEGQYPDVFQTPSKLSFVNHGTKKEQNAKFQSIKIDPIDYRTGIRITEILIMKAIKTIKIGAEIITNYGPDYSKLLRKKKKDNQAELNLNGVRIDRVVEGDIIFIKKETENESAKLTDQEISNPTIKPQHEASLSITGNQINSDPSSKQVKQSVTLPQDSRATASNPMLFFPPWWVVSRKEDFIRGIYCDSKCNKNVINDFLIAFAMHSVEQFKTNYTPLPAAIHLSNASSLINEIIETIFENTTANDKAKHRLLLDWFKKKLYQQDNFLEHFISKLPCTFKDDFPLVLDTFLKQYIASITTGDNRLDQLALLQKFFNGELGIPDPSITNSSNFRRPTPNQLTTTTKKRKRKREKRDSLKRKNYYVWVKDGKLVQQGTEGAKQITKDSWRQRQDRLNNKVWVKDGKLVQQGTEGAKQITKQAWKIRQDTVWVKDGKEVQKGTEGAEQITRYRWKQRQKQKGKANRWYDYWNQK
ncbi:MAG: SET domain-containing protein [Candidatus Marinamargulisbacteria bacterium]